MIRRTPQSGRVPFAYPALCPAPAPPVLAEEEQARSAQGHRQGVPGILFNRCRNSPAASGAHGPSSITICPARATSNLLRRPAGAVPTTGSRALKQAAPAESPALAAIVAAVDASISTFCWMTEHPPSVQRMANILITLQII